MRVMVVDDEPVESLLLASVLTSLNYEVETAGDGAEAWDKFQEHPSQIVIADWMMPEMDGIELCRRIRKITSSASTSPSYTYVILLTSKDQKEDRLTGLTAGADDFLVKPLDRGELTARLGVAERILRMESALREANQKVEQTRRHEIEIGAHIQRALLMARPPEGTSSFEFAAMNLPSSQIDGDFFDFFVHHPDIVDLFVGDAMGKGVPAALVGAGTKSFMLRAMSTLLAEPSRQSLPAPEAIVQTVHDGLTRELIRLNSFVTLMYARLDAHNHMATFVDCGHTKVIHWSHPTKKASTIEGDNFPIGFHPDEVYHEHLRPFDSGDLFCFYSDGVTEAPSMTDGLFGVDRLIQLIEEHHEESPSQILYRLREAIRTHTRNLSLEDDFTCVIVRVGIGVDRWTTRTKNFRSDLELLSEIRQFVGAAAIECGLDGTEIDELQLAAHEATTNVIVHAHKNLGADNLTYTAERLENGIRLSILYEAEPFTPPDDVEPDIMEMKEHGLGLFIIEQSVDEVVYGREPLSDRNVIAMTKQHH